LSEQIAAWENNEAIEEVTADERRRVYVSLHQTHLPRMDEAGVLQYENSRDTIELTEREINRATTETELRYSSWW
jgi:cobalamin biosynthesis protein CobD/CbiB